MQSLIQKLVETTSPSGYEAAIREVIRAEVEPLADEVRVDALGSLIAVKGRLQEGGCKIMLAAHMDEIGVIATHIDENGFIRFTTLGGVRRHALTGGRVRFLNGTLGVIYYEKLEDPNRLPTFEQMYIDVGARSREDCPVRVGEVASFERPFNQLGSRLIAKSLDDRIGVAVLIETLRTLAERGDTGPNQIFFVFSVQEEVGVRGATAAAFGIDPDLGLAVDVTTTGDTPKSARMEVSLGKGPAIKVRDSGMLADPRVVDWMARTAEKAGLPYQMEILDGGSTDARAIQLTRAGVPAGCLSIPCRYVHTPSEMVDMDDVLSAVRLMVELVGGPVRLG